MWNSPGEYTHMRLRAAAGDEVAKKQRDDYLETKRARNADVRAFERHRISLGDPEAIARHERRKAMDRASDKRRRELRKRQANETAQKDAPLSQDPQNEEQSYDSDFEDEQLLQNALAEKWKQDRELAEGIGVNLCYPTTRSGGVMRLEDSLYTGIAVKESAYAIARKNDKYVNSQSWEEYQAKRWAQTEGAGCDHESVV